MRHTAAIQADITAAAAKYDDYRRVALEGGEGHNPFTARLETLASEWDAAHAVEQDAEWTPEVTAARRAAWNAAVSAAGARPNVAALQSQTGIRLDDLRKHIARHAAAA